MAYRPVRGPQPENHYDNRWNSRHGLFGINRGPGHSAPQELPFAEQRQGSWYHGEKKLRHHRAQLYFVRPSDGKRAGWCGRLKDCLTNEGPDLFVTKCGDKRTFMRDRPQRWQWSGWKLSEWDKDEMRKFDKDFRKKDLYGVRDLRPANRQKRKMKSHYDYYQRRYISARKASDRGVPLDVRWEDNARRSDFQPLSYRLPSGWYTRIPIHSTYHPGGRPRET